MSQPFFSVIIPTFERYNFCSNAIDSVLDQSYPGFEVIIVDDHSSDGSYEKLYENYSQFEKVKILRNYDNLERGASRNHGIKVAKGKYLSFLDSDDIWENDHLQTIKNEIDNSDRKFMFATKFIFEDTSGRIIKQIELERVNGFVDYSFFLLGNPLACNVTVINDPLIIESFEESRNYTGFEDWIFLFLNTKKYPLKIIDRVTVKMNDHDGRSMRNDHENIIKKRKMATKRIEEKAQLTKKEQKILLTGTDYFNSVHAYLGNSRKESFKYLINSMKSGINFNKTKLAFRIAFF